MLDVMNGAAKGWSVPFVFYIHCTVSSSRPPPVILIMFPQNSHFCNMNLKAIFFFLNLDNNIV